MSKIATAERTKKADITAAEGYKQAEVLRAEGEKRAIILKSEGNKEAIIRGAEAEKQKVTLEAEAREREAAAEAKAIAVVSQAVTEGNSQALTYFLGQKYTEALQNMGESPNSKLIFMPLEASNVIGCVGSIAELVKNGIQLNSPKS